MLISLAFLIDLLLGDPVYRLHPIRIIGKSIKLIENTIYSSAQKHLKCAGIFLTITITIGTFLVISSLIILLTKIHYLLGLFFQLYIIYSSLSLGSLTKEGNSIMKLLQNNDLDNARIKVANIVSRDMSNEDNHGIIRATVESLTENLSDGVIAPIFFAIIGGAPLALTYKAINTLDSMVGYKNNRYINFGWASAKLDDIANYIPARLTGILIIITAFITKNHPLKAALAWFRDAQKGPSPNGGIPIVTFAGAVDIKLGGNCKNMDGSVTVIPFVGGKREKLNIGDIISANNFNLLAASIFVLIYSILNYILLN